MKIFSWVHRRFNNKVENVKKNGEDEQTFPGENNCNDIWRGGIFAIGTFGYNPLKDENDQHLIGYYDDDDDDDDSSQLEDEEEHNPLVLSTTHSFNYAGDSIAIDSTETATVENWSPEEEDELQVGFEYVMMKKQDRTTLADLFTADSQRQYNHSDTDTDTDTVTVTDTVTKKQSLNKKPADFLKEKSKSNHKLQGHSFANKLIAIHKINQVMRRMLKRKIHPHVGPTNSKVAADTTTHDYASLLPTLEDANM